MKVSLENRKQELLSEISMKKCKDCNNEYPNTKDYFYQTGNYLRNNCRKCENIKRKLRPSGSEEYMRRYDLNRRYGITLEKYENMWVFQDGKCAICDRKLSKKRTVGRQPDTACVDHCHKTKEVRAILCNMCNGAIGAFNEDPEVLKRAIDYLEKHNG